MILDPNQDRGSVCRYKALRQIQFEGQQDAANLAYRRVLLINVPKIGTPNCPFYRGNPIGRFLQFCQYLGVTKRFPRGLILVIHLDMLLIFQCWIHRCLHCFEKRNFVPPDSGGTTF